MLKLIIFCIIMLSLQSCSQKFYAPNAQNIPFFKEKNEARISIAKSEGHDFDAIEIQTAYSATNSIGLIANSFFTLTDEDNQKK